MYRAPTRQTALGIYPSIVGAACAALNWARELRAMPFRRMLAEMAGGQLMAGAVISTPERERIWLFSRPYFLEKLAVFSAGPDYRGLADLAGKRVGVIRGWSYGAAFDAARQHGEFQCEDVSADVHNFAKLLRGGWTSSSRPNWAAACCFRHRLSRAGSARAARRWVPRPSIWRYRGAGKGRPRC